MGFSVIWLLVLMLVLVLGLVLGLLCVEEGQVPRRRRSRNGRWCQQRVWGGWQRKAGHLLQTGEEKGKDGMSVTIFIDQHGKIKRQRERRCKWDRGVRDRGDEKKKKKLGFVDI
jgi:hypothetical protein